MELIDLLNKIANGEELAPKIQFHNMIWVLNSDLDYCEDYYSKDLDTYLFHNKWALTNNLNDEVIEIIEEDKKIEHLLNGVDFENLKDNEKFDYLYEMETRIINYLEENK